MSSEHVIVGRDPLCLEQDNSDRKHCPNANKK